MQKLWLVLQKSTVQPDTAAVFAILAESSAWLRSEFRGKKCINNPHGKQLSLLPQAPPSVWKLLWPGLINIWQCSSGVMTAAAPRHKCTHSYSRLHTVNGAQMRLTRLCVDTALILQVRPLCSCTFPSFLLCVRLLFQLWRKVLQASKPLWLRLTNYEQRGIKKHAERACSLVPRVLIKVKGAWLGRLRCHCDRNLNVMEA